MKQQRSADDLLGGVAFNTCKLVNKAKVEMTLLLRNATSAYDVARIQACLRALDFIKTSVEFAQRRRP